MQRLVLGTVLAAAYAWWVSGTAPFTAPAYVLIAVPCVTLVILLTASGAFSPKRADVEHYYQERRAGASLRSVTPWLVLLGVAIALEALGLARGGHSSAVPTLSTTLDHLLVTHPGRWALVTLWLGAGAAPLCRLHDDQVSEH